MTRTRLPGSMSVRRPRPSQAALPWGWGTLRRFQKRAATCAGFPHPTELRPQAFSTSRRFIPLATSPALFRAGSALGLSTFRGFPSLDTEPASRPALPLLSFQQTGRSLIACDYRDVRVQAVRSRRAGVTRTPTADPRLAFSPFEELITSGLAFGRTLLSWASVPLPAANRLNQHLLCRVSKNRKC